MPLNNKVPEFESLLEFQEVYLMAIELSWRDETFKKLLQEQPRLALERYWGYKLPWNIDLKFVEPDPNSSEKYGWNTSKPNQWHLPKHSLTFGVPEVPEEDDEVSLALAMYNDAGPTYLFTCC